MKKEEVKACAFLSWYSTFKHCTQISKILDIPNEVRLFLLSSQMVLPQSLKTYQLPCDYSDIDYEIWSNDDSDEITQPSFPVFEEYVNNAIKSLGGYVFPKLNWSSPKDAAWINFGNSLKCQTLGEILLLLKASDFVSHDLCTPFSLCTDFVHSNDAPFDKFTLILRKWHDYRPEGEYRCFVKSKSLKAISQRNCDVFYEFISENESKIVNVISQFFEETIKDHFKLEDYAFDIYLKQNSNTFRCHHLIDFNVFGPPTDALLFTWDELTSKDQWEGVEFRSLSDKALRSNSLSQYKMPIDLIDIASGLEPNKLIDLVQAHVEEQMTELGGANTKF